MIKFNSIFNIIFTKLDAHKFKIMKKNIDLNRNTPKNSSLMKTHMSTKS